MGKYSPLHIRCLNHPNTQAELHHVKSRGSGGKDETHNLMPLCRDCHSKVHTVGLNKFVKDNPYTNSWLRQQGWSVCELRNKWIREI